MPRRAPLPEAVAPVTALVPPPPPSPIIAKLRTDWRWAAISQFIWTFFDIFNIPDWDIETFEADLDGNETQVLPDVLAKLLFALTYNRHINRDNVFENLRKTYLKRAPERTYLGTIEEPIEWATLGLSQKVEIIHELCEWQLDNPARFRALLKTEDEEATWRVDPVGWDKAGNTYYLFDDNRLWVQRIPPAPPRQPKKTSLKAKRAERALRKSRPAPKKSHKKKTPEPRASASLSPPPPMKEEEVVSGSRKRTQVAFYGNMTPTVAALKRGGSSQNTPSSSRGTRSSSRIHGGTSTRSRQDAQSTPSRTRGAVQNSSPSRSTPLPLGTRVSRRLRNVDDEWQQIPDEWKGEPVKEEVEAKASAKGGKTKSAANGKERRAKKGDSDDESELSELTDEEEHEAELKAALTGEQEVDVKMEETKGSAKIEGTEGSLTPPPDEDRFAAKSRKVSETKEEVGSVDPEETKPESEEVEAVDEKPSENDDPMEEGEGDEDEEMDEVKLAAKKANELPEGFVEWEAVCVTLYDWRTFPEQFAKSRDPDEKALYQMLAVQVGPTIIDSLVAKEQERIKMEAVNNRKRSSRIAVKELEREEIMTRHRAQKEIEERMTAQQKEELRLAKEQEAALALEKAREDRWREREERAAQREEAAARKLIQEAEREEAELRKREARKRKREEQANKAANAGSAAPKAAAGDGADRWELACEVCRKTGWNIDEDEDLVCCDDCGRWQHTECHDKMDSAQGRLKRRWDEVDFQECRQKAMRKRQRLEEAQSNGHPVPLHGQAIGQQPSHHDPRQPVQSGQHTYNRPSSVNGSHGQPAGDPAMPSHHVPHPSQTQVNRTPAHTPVNGSSRPPHNGQPNAPQQARPVLPSLQQATGMTNGHHQNQPRPSSGPQSMHGYASNQQRPDGQHVRPHHMPQAQPVHPHPHHVQHPQQLQHQYPHHPQHAYGSAQPRPVQPNYPPAPAHHYPQQSAHPQQSPQQRPTQYPPQHQLAQHQPSPQHVPRASYPGYPPQGPPQPHHGYPPQGGHPGQHQAWSPQQAPQRLQQSPSAYPGQPLPPMQVAYRPPPGHPGYVQGGPGREQQRVPEQGQR